jgi:hypothetical protein
MYIDPQAPLSAVLPRGHFMIYIYLPLEGEMGVMKLTGLLTKWAGSRWVVRASSLLACHSVSEHIPGAAEHGASNAHRCGKCNPSGTTSEVQVPLRSHDLCSELRVVICASRLHGACTVQTGGSVIVGGLFTTDHSSLNPGVTA